MAIGALGIVATVASTLVGAVGAFAQGQAAASSAKYQQAVAQANQQIAMRNAERESQAGDQAAQANDLKNKAVMGEQLAEQGASGLDVGGGSPLAIRSSSEILGRLDTQNIKAQSQKQAYNEQVEAANFGNQANLFGMQARADNFGSYLSAGGSLLGGASAVSDKWLSYQQKGLLA